MIYCISLLLEGSHFKVFLSVLASRADFGGFFAFMDVATIAAFPIDFVIPFEIVAVFHHGCQFFVAVVMPLFNLSDFSERNSDIVIAFFLGNVCGFVVEHGEFFMLASSGCFEVFPGGPN